MVVYLFTDEGLGGHHRSGEFQTLAYVLLDPHVIRLSKVGDPLSPCQKLINLFLALSYVRF